MTQLCHLHRQISPRAVLDDELINLPWKDIDPAQRVIHTFAFRRNENQGARPNGADASESRGCTAAAAHW